MDRAPKRRWLTFSLRTLFVAVTLVSAAMGYLVWKARTLREQSQIIADLQSIGHVTFAHEIGRVRPATPPGPEVLRRVFGNYAFSELVQIQIDDERATDDTLARIATLPGTLSLILTSDNITDRGLAHIARMSELSALELESRSVTADGYARLRTVKLMALIFRGRNNRQRVDDSWILRLADLTRVRYLYLDDTRVTDAGLAELHRAKGLQGLWLSGTHATAEGVNRLQAALPNCKIVWP